MPYRRLTDQEDAALRRREPYYNVFRFTELCGAPAQVPYTPVIDDDGHIQWVREEDVC
jgi:hypothetical protein